MKNILPPVVDKGTFFIAISQFGSTFSMNFVAVFMPFYILKISHVGPQATMIWTGVISFTALRMLQTFAIAAVFPMIFCIFAPGLKGGKMGFLNSARFAGNSLGPLLATSVLAYSNLITLYLLISGLTAAALAAFLRGTPSISCEPVSPSAMNSSEGFLF